MVGAATYDSVMATRAGSVPVTQDSGDEPITRSTFPIRMHPGHGNSPQAPSALVTTPLIRVDLIGISHGAGSARTSETAPISDSHP